MKKTISTVLAIALALGSFAACSTAAKKDSDKPSIVATIFPEYDWVKNIAGDNADITLLLDKGVDLHSYQPTTEDLLTVATCDLFIYVGGESDGWVDDALKQSQNKDMKVINLMEVMGDSAYEEELKEGMEAEEEEEEEEEEGEAEYDEHVWLSLKSSKKFVRAITDSLKEIDAANAETYENNAASYIEKLDELDAKYEELCSGSSVDTLIFADRFPFRYMTEDYGLDYFAAFIGCSAETEASFETISFLAQKTDDLGLKYIFTIDNSDQKIANTVISNTSSKDQEILVLDSMQSADKAAADSGVTYLGVMESNYEVLKKALG